MELLFLLTILLHVLNIVLPCHYGCIKLYTPPDRGRLADRSNPVTGQADDILLPAEQSCTLPQKKFCNFDSGKSTVQ